MRYAFIFAAILASLLLFGCISQPSQSMGYSSTDVSWDSGAIVAAGVQATVHLPSAMSKHVFLVNGTQGQNLVYNTTFSSMVGVRTCTNSTANSTTDGCANTTAIGAGNYTLYKSNTSTFSMTLITTNSTLNNSIGNMNINIYGAYLNAQDTTPVGVYVKNRQGTYVHTGSSLATNTTGWTNVSGLPVATYVSALGVVDVMLLHNGVGINSSKSGISVDYLEINGTNTYNVTGGTNANVTMLGSIDCQNWFSQLSLVSVTTPQMAQVNNTLQCVKFNVTGVILTNSNDALRIKYIGVSG